ncbi:MAG TPA: YigZ family protein, partial [Ottowia sp.]|nr:YigZ family protein [Ottowia sp.]
LLAGGDSAAVDDGEPGGTAGRPMLHVLRQQALDGVLATVVRYFGGVKLGAGGLVRAYTDAVAQALLQARKVPVTRWAPLTCTLPYALEGAVRRALDAAAVRHLAVHHTEAVLMHFQVAADTAALLREQLKDIGQGQLQWVTDDDPARPGG